MKKKIYLALCILGILFPMWHFIPWLLTHGFNFPLFFSKIVANPISTAGWADLVIASIVFMFFVYYEGRRLKMTNLWQPVIATWCIGLSFGLPLFLLLREIHVGNNRR